MTSIPVITIQIIHIEGPLKGQIHSFTDSEITLGRHPSCHVTFPRELNHISRKHARIIREGNRFKLIDLSANGTLINGEPIKEKFLHDGDVVFMTEVGPKFSFIKEISNETMDIPKPQSPLATTPLKSVKTHQESPRPPAPAKAEEPDSTSTTPAPPPHLKTQTPEKETFKITVPASQQLVIQYGLGIMSFKQFPIVMGNHSDCDLTLQENNIHPRHAEITFADNAYIVNDLTGKGIVTLNGMAAVNLPMKVGAILKLSPSGPIFEFVGQGRLMAITPDTPPETSDTSSPPVSNDNRKRKNTLKKKGKKEKRKKFLGIF